MRIFLVKLVVFICSWEALYIFLLKPIRFPDGLLTEWLTISVNKVINIFINNPTPASWIKDPLNDACLIQMNGKTILMIYDDCNGLDLFIIYIAFIIFLPYPTKRKLFFSAAGLIAIFIGNIFRCFSLYLVFVHFRGMFDFNHHYVFTIIMYLIIFYGWVLYTKTPKTNEIS